MCAACCLTFPLIYNVSWQIKRARGVQSVYGVFVCVRVLTCGLLQYVCTYKHAARGNLTAKFKIDGVWNVDGEQCARMV